MGQIFIDARGRVNRAKAHYETFATTWEEFLEDEPYDAGVGVEDDGKGTIWVDSRYEQLPSVFGFVLGELLYQLRAALDASIYAAAIHNSGKNPPPNEQGLEFPICRSEANWKKSARKIAPLSKERRDLIYAIQPCNASKADDSYLWAIEALDMLNEWARIDRHRRLTVLGSWGANRSPKLDLPPGVNLLWLVVTRDNLLEDNPEVARFALEGWKPGMKIKANPDLTIDVALNEPPPPRDDSDTLSLRCQRMISAVELTVGLLEKAP